MRTLRRSSLSRIVATLALRECEDEDSHSEVGSHVGRWSFGGLSNLQKTIIKVKTPCIGEFFISLESYGSVDV